MHVSKKIAAVAATVSALGLAATPALAQSSHATAKAIKVTATEWHFKLSTSTVAAPGSVVFTVVNTGKLAHDFKINGKKTPLIAPGKSSKLTVRFKAGKFKYLCTVPGHAAAGMKGVLTVK